MKTKKVTAPSREKELFGVEPCGLLEVKMKDFNPKYEYCIINVVGNCMDSDLSPVRIKDGDSILIHQIPLQEWDIMENVRKVVCIMLNDGRCFVKQLVFWDGISWGIRVKMFIPKEEVFFVPLNKIKALFVVDEVYSPEYVREHSKMPKQEAVL